MTRIFEVGQVSHPARIDPTPRLSPELFVARFLYVPRFSAWA